MLSHLTYLVLQHYLAKGETQKTVHWCFLHATQSTCCSAVDLLSLEPCLQSPKLNALITIFRESYSSVSMSRESKRLKKSSSNWLNSGNAQLIQRAKRQCPCFPFCQVYNAEHKFCAGIVKRLLIAYFIGNISAMCVNVIAS